MPPILLKIHPPQPPKIALYVLIYGKNGLVSRSIQAEHGRSVKNLGHIVMPDHFHGVLFVEERMDISVGRIIRGFKVACTQRWRLLTGQPSPLQGQPSLVDTPTKGNNGAQNEGLAWIDYGRTSLNDHNNQLIYKAFPKTRRATPFLASPFTDLLIFLIF